MRDVDQSIERLRAISRLIIEARDIADLEGEHMLGAKLEDCLICAQERIQSLDS